VSSEKAYTTSYQRSITWALSLTISEIQQVIYWLKNVHFSYPSSAQLQIWKCLPCTG